MMLPPSKSASFRDSGSPSPVPFTRPCSRMGDLTELLEDEFEILAGGDPDPCVADCGS